MTEIDGRSTSDAPNQDTTPEEEDGGSHLVDLSETSQMESAPTSKM